MEDLVDAMTQKQTSPGSHHLVYPTARRSTGRATPLSQMSAPTEDIQLPQTMTGHVCGDASPEQDFDPAAWYALYRQWNLTLNNML